MASLRLLVRSARQVVQVVSRGEGKLSGGEMKDIAILQQRDEDGSEGYSVAIGRDGTILAIGLDSEVDAAYPDRGDCTVIDSSGKCIIPGLVDGHTHSVWAGDRVHEFAMKLAGATYMEVHEAGGGIMFTVDHVRRASEDDLYATFKTYAGRMLAAGTTLAECKSGYGLDADTEMKMLRVLERGRRDPEVAVDISSTYCGAHAVPRGSTPEEATRDVLEVQLPRLQDLRERGELHVDNVDVFCEKGVFDVEQSARILKAGVRQGLAINFHGEELNRLNSAEMGASLGARAISHLECVSEEGMAAMARAGTLAVVLPTTAYILRLDSPPVRRMIEAGVAVALGSDFNPNAHCMAMPVVLHLACVLFHMSMPEALAAATINGAASLGKSQRQGSLEVGKLGDLVILDAPRWEHIIYQLGSYHHVISHVIKEGVVVHSRDAKT